MFLKRRQEEELAPEEEIDDLTPERGRRTEEDYDDYGYGDDLDLGLGDYGDGLAPMEKHAELLKDLTNFDPYLQRKFREWLALIWDDEKKEYAPNKYAKAIMNEKCAAWCISFMNTYTRENNIITNIGQSDYDDLRDDIIDVVWFNLGTRAEEFGLEAYGDIQRVCTELQHSAELALMGAGDGKYNKLLSETVHRAESVVLGSGREGRQQPVPPPKRGVLSRLRFLVRGG